MDWDLFREIAGGLLALLCLPAVYALSAELFSGFRAVRFPRALADGLLAGAAGALALLAGPFSARAPMPAAGLWLPAAAAYLSGPAAAAAACGMVILARLPLGGQGALYAAPAALACAACGLLWRRALRGRGRGGWPALLLLGLAVQGAAFASALPLGAPDLPPFLWRAAFGTAAVAAACRFVRAPEAGSRMDRAAVYDIPGLLREQSVLREQDRTLRQLIDSVPLTIYIQSEGRIAYINRAGVRLFGAASAEELLGTPVVDHMHSEYRRFVEGRIRSADGEKAETPRAEEVYRRQDGTPLYVEVKALPTVYKGRDSAVVFVRDMAEHRETEGRRLKVEAQIRQQQKLEAIGTLAGGVAHEINNPLNGIMNYAQLILDQCAAEGRKPGEETIVAYGSEIVRETRRISEIVRSLLQFSRQEKQSHSYASLYDIVDQTMMLIKTIVKRDQIQLDIRLDEGLPAVKCRSQQIQQVLMNLMTNARDALNEKYPGYDENKRITVRCSEFEDAGRRWVRLTVEDTGPGIAPAVREKMFEPFFSTKPKELGTGLGLAISHGIVKDHHGRIEVETRMGQYTRFMVVLPVDNGWNLEKDEQPKEDEQAEEPDEQGTDR